MAILSTHTLNSVDGSHAGGVALKLVQLSPDGTRHLMVDSATDADGRFMTTLELSDEDTQASYEMVLQSGAYFAGLGLIAADTQIVQEVVMRFSMPDAERRYHIPFMLAPHSYSVWWGS